MNKLNWNIDYADPKKSGVDYSCRDFFLNSDANVRLGVWHILPKSLSQVSISSPEYEALLSTSDKPIVLYFHGNSWSRAGSHRVLLYNILAKNDYHVIAVDYRGYGNSTGEPSEEGVIHDAMFVYRWVKNRSAKNRIFVWGHSLGSAIGTAAVEKACKEGIGPDGLILEAPFNNLNDIVRSLTKNFHWLPFFDEMVMRPFSQQGLFFKTDESIEGVQCPILMLHSRDDKVIPFSLAEKLRTIAIHKGRKVTFVEFDKYGHEYICNSPQMVEVFRTFVAECNFN